MYAASVFTTILAIWSATVTGASNVISQSSLSFCRQVLTKSILQKEFLATVQKLNVERSLATQIVTEDSLFAQGHSYGDFLRFTRLSQNAHNPLLRSLYRTYAGVVAREEESSWYNSKRLNYGDLHMTFSSTGVANGLRLNSLFGFERYQEEVSQVFKKPTDTHFHDEFLDHALGFDSLSLRLLEHDRAHLWIPYLQESSFLKKVNLASSSVLHPQLLATLSRNRNLQELSIYISHPIDFENLSRFLNSDSIQTLTVYAYQSVQGTLVLPKLPNLKTLRIFFPPPAGGELTRVSGWENVQGLETLILSNDLYPVSGVSVQRAVPRLRNLVLDFDVSNYHKSVAVLDQQPLATFYSDLASQLETLVFKYQLKAVHTPQLAGATLTPSFFDKLLKLKFFSYQVGTKIRNDTQTGSDILYPLLRHAPSIQYLEWAIPRISERELLDMADQMKQDVLPNLTEVLFLKQFHEALLDDLPVLVQIK